MATIPEMLRRLKSVNLESQVPVIISNTSGEMVKLNREQLKLRGENSKGITIKSYAPYNSVPYALQKNQMNPSPGLFNPDLFLTGAFARGFYAKVSQNKVIFGSTDFKSDDLERKYGKQIFGLTKDSKRVYLDTSVMPEIRRYITQQTGLRFT